LKKKILLALQTSEWKFGMPIIFSPNIPKLGVELWIGNPKGFFLFTLQKLWKSQNSMPRFGFPNTLCFWCSKVWHWTIKG
jgi:hypothetical protein